MDAAVERTGMYLQRVQKVYVDQLLYSLVFCDIAHSYLIYFNIFYNK
jgi:hypothetical protein